MFFQKISNFLRTVRTEFLISIRRKKPLHQEIEPTKLKRCLGVIDLTCLSIGAIIGSGIFMFAGGVIRDLVGPAIILSFIVAGIPTIISALCFAEFGARVPKAGSTYVFVYVTLGEFWAALVGWFMVTSPIFFAAAEARSWAAYFDSMFENKIANGTKQFIGTFNSPYLNSYPDFFAAAILLIACVIVASGAKFSTLFNNIFTAIKLLVIGFIICYGFTFADGSNWTSYEKGGFLPFGFAGVMSAAPIAFYAYCGFEAACTAAEEARNPKRDLVIAIVIAFIIAACVYILMCSALTLMIPYNEVAEMSSFASAFSQRGQKWATYVVAVGVLSALTNVLFASVFALPRYVYSMASDGLIFNWLAVVNHRTKVPVRAIAVFAILTIIVILIFNLKTLIDFLSMGGLLCYTLVSASVIVLRYRPRNQPERTRTGLLKENYVGTFLDSWFGHFAPGNVVLVMVAMEVLIMIPLSAAIRFAPWDYLRSAGFCVAMVAAAVLLLVLIIQQILISLFQQHDDSELWFRVPLVPWLPSLSMLINILMIMNLEPLIWGYFAVYLLIGFLIYFFYGMFHSTLRYDETQITSYEMNRSKEITMLT